MAPSNGLPFERLRLRQGHQLRGLDGRVDERMQEQDVVGAVQVEPRGLLYGGVVLILGASHEMRA